MINPSALSHPHALDVRSAGHTDNVSQAGALPSAAFFLRWLDPPLPYFQVSGPFRKARTGSHQFSSHSAPPVSSLRFALCTCSLPRSDCRFLWGHLYGSLPRTRTVTRHVWRLGPIGCINTDPSVSQESRSPRLPSATVSQTWETQAERSSLRITLRQNLDFYVKKVIPENTIRNVEERLLPVRANISLSILNVSSAPHICPRCVLTAFCYV